MRAQDFTFAGAVAFSFQSDPSDWTAAEPTRDEPCPTDVGCDLTDACIVYADGPTAPVESVRYFLHCPECGHRTDNGDEQWD